jgi:threonine dehydrogenase-like Zn-dependent dehydrogenase
MRAVVCHHGDLKPLDLPTPQPEEGQVLLDVIRCGICGSDLHARRQADLEADALAEIGYDGFMRSDQEVVFGHEFCGTVAEYGPGRTSKVPVGTTVVALPLRRAGAGIHPIGLSASAPGAYAQQLVVEEAFMMPVPNGLSPDLAVLTEPMAIGRHAVKRAEIQQNDAALVIGCGPVGLAVICMLQAEGVETIVASDFSVGRRQLAWACGATAVVDPREGSPFDQLDGRGYVSTLSVSASGALQGMQLLQQGPEPWHVTLRALELAGATKPQSPVIFECVGIPGVIDGILADAPLSSRVVVAGVCIQPDQFRPVIANNKEIDLRFVVGYSALEFRDTLHLLAEGKVDASPIVTGTVGLDAVERAFDDLADPDRHAKILIDPSFTA